MGIIYELNHSKGQVSANIEHMDSLDRKILFEVLEDARVTVTALAETVQLSVSACHRRLRDLEKSGVITGYRATIDPGAVGRSFQALVFVTMRDGSSSTLIEYETAVAAVPDVIDAQRLFGDPDYLLRVATSDLEHFQHLYDTTLATLPGVLRLSTTLVMKRIVDNRPLPIQV
jgi:DNA-binding Lrp family transcriptional regulator